MAIRSAANVTTYAVAFDTSANVAPIIKDAAEVAFPATFTTAPTAIGFPFVYTAANWSGAVFKFAAYFKAVSGSVSMDLYDITAAAQVSGSQHTNATQTVTLYKSGALTLVNGHSYIARVDKTGNASGLATGAVLIAEMP